MKNFYFTLISLASVFSSSLDADDSLDNLSNKAKSSLEEENSIFLPNGATNQECTGKEENIESLPTLTCSVSLVSDYRIRGISQTMRQPAIQGGFEYRNEVGIYLGTWASNVDGTTHFFNNTSLEWDFYGGFRDRPFLCSVPNFEYNVGLIYYYYPNGKPFTPHKTYYNTAEFFIELTYDWLNVKYFQSITNFYGIDSDNRPFNWRYKFFNRPNGSSRGSTYIEANASFNLIQRMDSRYLKIGKLDLLLHLGHQAIRHYDYLSFTDWRITLTQELAWFNLFFSYVGTNANPDYYDVPDNAFYPKKYALGAQGIVFGVTKQM